jgi:hypothetical protein
MKEPERFTQGEAVRDFVFPLAQVRRERDGSMKFDQYLGTAFLIGNRGFALTAAHVVRAVQPEFVLAGLFASNGWHGFSVRHTEHHPSEDVAVLQLEGGSWNSPFHLAGTWEGASREYELWGYPTDAVITAHDPSGKLVPAAPDLVYFKGYIRRRITRAIPGLTGESFFELSQPAYGGCSGGPLWCRGQRGSWRVVGIYAGYLPTPDTKAPFLSVGYAIREEAFRDWMPRVMARRVADEAAESTLGITA